MQRKAADASAAPARGPSDGSVAAEIDAGFPLPSALADRFGVAYDCDLSDVRVHVDSAAATRRDARAFATGRHIVFAPGEYDPESQPGLFLLAHELAHVAQQAASVDMSPAPLQRRGNGPAIADDAGFERDADRVAAAAISGDAKAVPRALPSGSAAPVQHAPPKPGSPPASIQAPFVTRIEPVPNGPVPASLGTQIVMEIPGFGHQAGARQTFKLDRPVIGATQVTFYSVPLSDLYESPEVAAEARRKPEDERHGLSIAGRFDVRLTRTKPAPGAIASTAPVSSTVPSGPVASTAPSTTATAAGVGASSVEATHGLVPAAGPARNATIETAYDIDGHPLGIIERGPNFGITTEYTKLAVGAGSCNVLKTAEGITLIDAGVRLSGKGPDKNVEERTIRRLHELIGEEPIREIVITHSHLDHVGLLERISREFVVERITLNAAQALDSQFRKAVAELATHQREVVRKRLSERFKEQRNTWDADRKVAESSLAQSDAAARDLAFGRWVDQQVAIELVKAPPVAIHVALPEGSTLNAADIKVESISLQLEPAPGAVPGAGEAIAATAPGRTTLMQSDNAEVVNSIKEGLAVDPKFSLETLDAAASSYLMKLPNGNQLLVLSDIRTADFLSMQNRLSAELAKLGAPVEFRMWDMSHHAQAGWVSGKDHPIDVPEAKSGVMSASQLMQITEQLSKITAKSAAASGVATDALVVSVDLAKISPQLLLLLEACGLAPMIAHGAQDVVFAEAMTAADRRTSGFTEGVEYGDRRIDPVLRRTEVALQDLRRRLDIAAAEVPDEHAEREQEATERDADLAPERELLQSEIKSLRGKLRTATRNVETPGKSVAKRPLVDREAARADLQARLDGKLARLNDMKAEVKSIRARVGPAEAKVSELRSKIATVDAAKLTFVEKVRATPHKTVTEPAESPGEKPVKRRVLDIEEGKPAPFEASMKALVESVDPVYHQAIDSGQVPRLTETSLVLLGKNAASTTEGKELLETWQHAESLRNRIAAQDLPLHAHAELLQTLDKLKSQIAARKDIAGQMAAVTDELAFIDKQIAESGRILNAAAQKGEASVTRDPGTGMRVESHKISETTIRQAQARAGVDDGPARKAPAVGEPGAAPSDAVDAPAAVPGAGAAEMPGVATRLTQSGAAVFGRAMGGVMVWQTITGAGTMLKRYNAHEANVAETVAGATKTALGISVGVRMARGMHVGMGEFAILSVIDVTQTALSDYRSSEEFNTEVTYAIVRNGVNLALAAVGMAMMETANPIGIIGGLAVMMLGDTLLDWLGVHDWLAKKFAFMPDAIIEVQTDLDKLIKDYNVIIGSIELQAEDDVKLGALGADPAALRLATTRLVAARRPQLRSAEHVILWEFEAAYKRARSGYAGLRELDDLRFRFVSAYERVHAGDAMADLPSSDAARASEYANVSRGTVKDTFAAIEQSYEPDNVLMADIPNMKQWSRMDEEIESLVGQLYHTDDDDIDWMKVSEYEHNLDLMVSNARYRLDPAAQGSRRATPLFSRGTPGRDLYEAELARRETKLDVLRRRQLDIAMHGHSDTGVKKKGEWVFDMELGLVLEPATYYEPEWKSTQASTDTEAQLALGEMLMLHYSNQIFEMGKLPDDLTVTEIYSDEAKLAIYDNDLTHDGDYSARIFALRGSRSSTMAGLDRLHRLLDGRDLTAPQRARIARLDADWKRAEEDRLVDSGYLLMDEVPPLKAKIASAKVTALAAAFGPTRNPDEMTDEEHAATQADELSDFKLSSLRDRIVDLGLRLPEHDDEPIDRVFRLARAPAVIVGARPGAEMMTGVGEGAGAEGEPEYLYKVLPLNAAAIAYYRDHAEHVESDAGMEPVTVGDLKKMISP